MPQTGAAKKALRVSRRRRTINDRWRNTLRSLERKFRQAMTGKKSDEAHALYGKLQSTIDRMARRHIVHRNTAARTKSRLSVRLQKALAS